MVSKKKVAAAAFGAAMATMYAAPELQADIVDLSFSPGSWAFNTASFGTIAINEVPGIGPSGSALFGQWNDGVGKTIFTGGGGLSAIGVVNYSDTLVAGGFTGGTSVGFSTGATGTAYIGFSAGGNVGWFQIDLGGAGGAVTYLGGEYGNAGESVHVGGTVVPEPTSFAALAGLALGAAGIRRNRKK